MNKKNSIILFLCISNGICLYYAVTQSLPYKKSRTLAAYKNSYTDAFLKKGLADFYQTDKNSCGGAVSVRKQDRFTGWETRDMACLLDGNRSVVWTTLEDTSRMLERMLLEQLVAFEQLVKKENIQEIDGISYSPEGQRNALLLAQFLALEEKSLVPFNDYLTGLLLGYAEDDIIFFYQRSAFIHHLDEQDPGVDVPFSHEEFSPEMNAQFQVYLKNIWPTSASHKRLIENVAFAQDWLKEHEHDTIEDLEQQLADAKKAKASTP